MFTVKCDKCGREVEADSSGGLVSDGTQWTDEKCRHCHACVYEECDVFVKHSSWVCGECKECSARGRSVVTGE